MVTQTYVIQIPMYKYSAQHDIKKQIITKIVTKLPEML